MQPRPNMNIDGHLYLWDKDNKRAEAYRCADLNLTVMRPAGSELWHTRTLDKNGDWQFVANASGKAELFESAAESVRWAITQITRQHNQNLALIWRYTHSDYKELIDGVRHVFVWRAKTGKRSVPLHSLTHNEFEEHLSYAKKVQATEAERRKQTITKLTSRALETV